MSAGGGEGCRANFPSARHPCRLSGVQTSLHPSPSEQERCGILRCLNRMISPTSIHVTEAAFDEVRTRRATEQKALPAQKGLCKAPGLRALAVAALSLLRVPQPTARRHAHTEPHSGSDSQDRGLHRGSVATQGGFCKAAFAPFKAAGHPALVWLRQGALCGQRARLLRGTHLPGATGGRMMGVLQP